VREQTWCSDCASTQHVEDQFVDDTGDSRATVEEYSVTVLSCGHTIERTTRTYWSPLQQAGLPRSASLPDPFELEGESR
jgi:hypothetical protein